MMGMECEYSLLDLVEVRQMKSEEKLGVKVTCLSEYGRRILILLISSTSVF